MSGISKRSIDFDAWMELADTNPEAFEFVRQRMIDALIADARQPERLKRLQWRIDVERTRAKNSMSACAALSGMMLESVYGECGLARILDGQRQGEPGQVVSFAGSREDT